MTRALAVGLLAAGAMAGCGSEADPPTAGAEGGPCLLGGLCSGELVCVDGTCRAGQGDGDASDAAPADTPEPTDTPEPADTGPLDDSDGSDGSDGGPVDPQDGAPGDDGDGADADLPPPCTTDSECVEALSDALGACDRARCLPEAGGCVVVPAADGAACVLNDPCTLEASCQAGTCQTVVEVDCSDGNPCTLDLCDSDEGCEHPPAIGDDCDDGNPCTVGDQCLGAQCVGEETDGCSCGVDADCGALEDGDACNGTLACIDGTCVGAPDSVVSCAAIAATLGPCEAVACEPSTGECVVSNADGLPCDDGNPCTLGDLCSEGQCASGANICTCEDTSDCAAQEDGDLCNGTLTCVGGQCVTDTDTVVVCPDAPAAGCTLSQCDPTTGACVDGPKANGALCDDGDVCTTQDACTAGACEGAVPVVCDDGEPCTVDFCDNPVGCLSDPLPGPCDDGSVCTEDDVCVDGTCTGTSIVCEADGPCEAVNGCDPEFGCLFVFTSAPCEDGDACTTDDYCQGGGCQGVAADCDDGNGCTIDVCDSGGELGPSGEPACVHLPNSEPCDDGDLCTSDDVCAGGACVGVPLTCVDGDPCTSDSCQDGVGCVFSPSSGAPCEDFDPCTQNTVCSFGSCVGQAIVCDDGNPCTVDACSPVNGCVASPLEASCDDGDACTTEDACDDGACVGVPVACYDGNPCTDDACDPAVGCALAVLTIPCDDGDACTTDDTCATGACAGTPTVCDDGSPCTDDVCDSGTGACLAPWNGDCACSSDEVCQDGNPCTVASCVDNACVVTDLEGVACEDGKACTVFDTCSGGQCSGTLKPCDDGDGCTSDWCVPSTGTCQFEPNGLCLCQGDTGCDDANPCTADVCGADGVCTNTATAGLPCDDGQKCTDGDVCLGASCVGITGACDDGEPCTFDLCQPATGLCLHKPGPLCECLVASDCEDGDTCTVEACTAGACGVTVLDTPCDDGDACSVEDTCGAYGCVGAPLGCDDGEPCTLDACDPVDGCSSTTLTGSCDDGDACTEGDSCVDGECVGVALECDDGNICTDDLCQAFVGCVAIPNVAPCDDGDPCSGPDACSNGSCAPGPPTGADGCLSEPEFCGWNWKLICDGSHEADTSSGASDVTAWPGCVDAGDYSGTEFVYKYTATCTGVASATLVKDAGVEGAFDVAVVEAGVGANPVCDPTACVAGAAMSGNQATAFFDVVDGTTYYVAVEGRDGASGGFSMAMGCDCGGDPIGTTCEPEGNVLACGGLTSADTTGGVSGVDSWAACVGLSDYAAPEAAWTFEAPCDGLTTVSVTKDPSVAGSFDLFVVDNTDGTCDATSCVDAAFMTGGVATAAIPTVGGQPYVIVVDGYAGAEGAFDVSVACDCGFLETECANSLDDDDDGLTDCEDDDCDTHPNCVTTGACVQNYVAQCGTAYSHTTASAPATATTDSWGACVIGSDYTAPENVYALVPPCTGGVTVSLTKGEDLIGQQLALLAIADLGSGCSPAGCLSSTLVAGDDGQITFEATEGVVHYIVVDGLDGAAGSYELGVSCPCAPAELECADGVDNDDDGDTDCADFDCQGSVACGLGDLCTATVAANCGTTYTGSTSTGSTDVSSYDTCLGSGYEGPEVVYKFFPNCHGTMTATLDVGSLASDLDIAILKDNDNVCAAGACTAAAVNIGGTASTVVSMQESVPLYVVVDGPVGADGSYELAFDCTCGPVEVHCGDLIDDDGDGQTDCLDLEDCGTSPWCDPTPLGCSQLLGCVAECFGDIVCTQGCFASANEETQALFAPAQQCYVDFCESQPVEFVEDCLSASCPDTWAACTADLPVAELP